MPTLTAKQIPNGILKDYWVRLGLYQVIFVFEVNEEELVVWIDGIKHKREDVYWKKNRRTIIYQKDKLYNNKNTRIQRYA